MIQGVLAQDVLKDATQIVVEPIGALDNFDVGGGVAYLGQDRVTYTSITPSETYFTLEGCAGVDYSHKQGEDISPYFGARVKDVVPPALRNSRYDSDGIADAMFQIMETGVFAKLKDAALNVHKNINPVLAEAQFLKYLCSNLGLEHSDKMPEDVQRSLARHAADLLSLRCTEQAFRFLVWHVLGYYLNIDIKRTKLLAKMNDRNFPMYIPPTEFALDSRGASYWKFTEGVGTTVANEVSGGSAFTLLDVAQWNTDSMFPKDLSIELDVAHPYIHAVGTSITKGFLYGKNQFALEWFMKPASAGPYPAKVLSKGTLIEAWLPNATDLEVLLSDGVSTISHTFENCITENRWNYVAVLFDRPTLTLCIDGEIIGSSIVFDVDIIDDGSPWEFGDSTATDPFYGLIDTFMVSVGKKYPMECFEYFNHIRKLRTYDTEVDENAYMLDDFSDDGRVTVVVLNGDGDKPKTNFLEYLITEWLTLDNYEVVDLTHLPLELGIGFF